MSGCRRTAAHEENADSGKPERLRPFLAAAESAIGNDAEAKLAVAEARRLTPQLTIKWFLEHGPVPQLPTIVLDGLRSAGLPDE